MSADTPRQALEKFVRAIMRDVTYHKHYLATVMSQAPTGTEVDVLPDDALFKGQGLSGVALDTIPGVTATVPPGAKVTLYFDGGNRQKPRCRWVEGSPISLAFADGVLPVARVGDQVTVTVPPGVAGGPAVGFIIGGSPLVKSG